MKIVVDKKKLTEAIYAALDAQADFSFGQAELRQKDDAMRKAKRDLWDVIEGAPEEEDSEGGQP